MSRIGRMPITIPAGVEVKLNGQHITVKGAQSTLEMDIHPDISVSIDGNIIKVERPSDEKEHRSLHGLTRSLINNMVVGVSQGFTKELDINGVGYKAAKQGKTLTLSLGYSHPVVMEVPNGLSVTQISNTEIEISGIDKVKIGEFAANIRKVRSPEPYKGKGIKYKGEQIRRKEGKKASK